MDKETSNQKIAVVRIRGLTGVMHDIDDDLRKLMLYKKNYCVIVSKTAAYVGMVKKAKDYVTWGEIDEKTYNDLIEKRGRKYTDSVSDKKVKNKKQ